ncbi:universal stress protein [Halomicrococcus sp. SG-WS-1]|uniref:universal stress protein n=1 Tax=Halomicrococcus sp. SG-WS-1 TaxID=3439057 RepID=UPI003F7A89EE
MTDTTAYEQDVGAYERILVPTDGSAPSDRAARHATALAAAFDATLHVLHVVDARRYSSGIADLDDVAREQEDRLEATGEKAVATVAERADDAGVATVSDVVTGVPSAAILDYVDDYDVDLIAMGTHGRTGLDRILVGSVTERVLRQADVPVLSLRATGTDDGTGTPTEYDDVLVATDGREGVSPAVAHALTVAERYDATVHALFVVDVRNVLVDDDVFPEANVNALAALEDLGERATDAVAAAGAERGVEVTTTVQQGVPSSTIREVAGERGADLIAMGTHGRSGLERYLVGSVTETVLRHTDVPVLSARRTDAK